MLSTAVISMLRTGHLQIGSEEEKDGIWTIKNPYGNTDIIF